MHIKTNKERGDNTVALKYVKPTIEAVVLLTEECLAAGSRYGHWGSPACVDLPCVNDQYWKSPNYVQN